jgi:hypothetical protein
VLYAQHCAEIVPANDIPVLIAPAVDAIMQSDFEISPWGQ